MLSKIILHLSMNLSVLDASMRYEESMYPIFIMLWLNMILVGDVPKILYHVAWSSALSR
jgi:hypothetical protein